MGRVAILGGAAGEGEEPRGEYEEEGRRRVAAVVPALVPFLDDDDPDVRRAVIRISSLATGEAVREVLERLDARYDADPDAWTRADVLTVLTRLDPDAEAVRHRLDTALKDRPPPCVPWRRWSSWSGVGRRIRGASCGSWPRPWRRGPAARPRPGRSPAWATPGSVSTGSSTRTRRAA
ncbi:hypothetical protein QFZ82_002025 [Streptomyces sp. V4I23]|uniref:hypothetical protein n=1 Tax=Streptomyces sp. V4I23 TaxID=3042282 RepID=UPI00278233DA|nr:hypothetical protein [Streptomyces sp. V4I23]MDQ1007540.1 hypothetical protein [Streptomyces sp. V4I23]